MSTLEEYHEYTGGGVIRSTLGSHHEYVGGSKSTYLVKVESLDFQFSRHIHVEISYVKIKYFKF